VSGMVEELSTTWWQLANLRLSCRRRSSELLPPSARLLAEEVRRGLRSLVIYQDFQARADRVKDNLLVFLLKTKNARVKKVAAYGAAAKGNTLPQLRLGREGTTCYHLSTMPPPPKQGKFMPGSHNPHPWPRQCWPKQRPDYLLILPWNIATEVKQQKRLGLQSLVTKFVTAVPELAKA